LGGGQVGFGGGAVGVGKRPAPGKAPMVGFNKLEGAELKKLVGELRKQAVAGVMIRERHVSNEVLAGLKQVTGLRGLWLTGPDVKINADGLKHLAKLKLHTLCLEGTALTDADLEEVAKQKGLVRLYLGGTKITNKGLEHLRGLEHLKLLRLTWTGVDGDGLKSLRSVKSLEALELAGSFTDKDMEALKELTGLKVLRLHQTRVTDAGLKQVEALTNLQVLTIDAHFNWYAAPEYLWGIGGLGGFGGFGGIGGGAVGGGPALQLGGALGAPALQLGGPAPPVGGAFFGVPPPRLGGMPDQALTPDRKMVKIGASPVTGAGLKQLKSLKLVELNLRSGKLADADLKELAPLTTLKKLRVWAPEVTDKGLDNLTDLKALELLDMRMSKVMTDLGALKGLPKLRVVYTNISPFDPQYKTKIAEARKSLPRVTIHPLFPAPKLPPPGKIKRGGGVGSFPIPKG
jgi:hypothetical protein